MKYLLGTGADVRRVVITCGGGLLLLPFVCRCRGAFTLSAAAHVVAIGGGFLVDVAHVWWRSVRPCNAQDAFSSSSCS